MVLNAVASTMMSIEFLTDVPINQYTYKHHQNGTSSTWNLRKYKDCIMFTAAKGVTLVVKDNTENITKCEALLQDNLVYQRLISNYPQRTN